MNSSRIIYTFSLFLILIFLSLSTLPGSASRAPPKPGSSGSSTGSGGTFPGGYGFPGNLPPAFRGIIGNGGSGGWGGGYGGPSGGSGSGGVIRPVVTCKIKGPCYGKKLRCPAKCFTSWSRSGKGYGGGGGGGGCSMDCKKKCTTSCST
ncbi:hypothetical protein AgCh_020330 [Apium graveolens]